ncbi:MAG: hypothetical protein OXG56_11050 [Gammaproteobacteria bacterium]|nr:hypothetical protein [Gammaproteobacteria bacterium]
MDLFDRTRLPDDGPTRLSNPCRDWCERAIHLARENLVGRITLFYRSFRSRYAGSGAEYGEFEHLELEMAGDNDPVVFSVTFVAVGAARYQPFQKSGHGYAAVCLLPDLAEAMHIMGLLQTHLDAGMQAQGGTQDGNPVRMNGKSAS